MGAAYPHERSGEGDVYAADRLEATLTYVSQTDVVGGDPYEPVLAVCPRGTPHPNAERFPELEAERYVAYHTVNPLVWLVDVTFNYRDVPGFAGWATHVTIGDETVRVYRDLDGQIVGSHAYDIQEAGTQTAYFANGLKGTVNLSRPEGDVRRREGMDLIRGAGSLVLTRRFASMNMTRVRAIQGFIPSVNRMRFLAYAPNELLFRYADVSEEHGPTGAGRKMGLNYPVELHFSVRLPSDDEPEAWRTLRQLDFFTDDRGNESLVMERIDGPDGPTDRPVESIYVRYLRADFYDVLAIIEGGAPRSGLWGPGKG